MWGTFTCHATTSPVAATAARASSSSSRRAEKRFATVGGSAHAAGRRVALKAAAEGAATEETEDVIPRVEGEFIWDEDRPFHRCAPRREGGTERPPAHPAISHRRADVPRVARRAPFFESIDPRKKRSVPSDRSRPFPSRPPPTKNTRHRDLEYFRLDMRGARYGGADLGADASRAARAKASRAALPSPATYKVTTPPGYDAARAKPYPVIVIIPADAGFGGVLGSLSGTDVLCSLHDRKFHEKHDAIVCEIGFNRPSWVADTSATNHESFLLDVVLPRLVASHNCGRLSLLGYSNGGFGALHMLMRHPDVFHRAAVCDAPVLGDFEGVATPWGVDAFEKDPEAALLKPPRRSFVETFPHNAMFAPYGPGTLATCPDVGAAMRANNGEPRLALWAGADATWEMGAFREQLAAFDVPHVFSDAFEHQPGSWEGGWVEEAIEFLASDL